MTERVLFLIKDHWPLYRDCRQHVKLCRWQRWRGGIFLRFRASQCPLQLHCHHVATTLLLRSDKFKVQHDNTEGWHGPVRLMGRRSIWTCCWMGEWSTFPPPTPTPVCYERQQFRVQWHFIHYTWKKCTLFKRFELLLKGSTSAVLSRGSAFFHFHFWNTTIFSLFCKSPLSAALIDFFFLSNLQQY